MYESSHIPFADGALRTIGDRSRRLSYCVVTALVATAVLSCAASPACRQGPADDAQVVGRTAGEAVKTGVTTGVAGVKAGGSAVGGYVAGGSDEAGKEWEEGKRDTKAKANAGAVETEHAASVPECRE